MRHGASRREGHDVAPDKHAGLLRRIVAVIVVEIPVELGPGGRGQVLEQLFLALRQRIEARNDEAARTVETELAAAQPLDGRALHHAAIGDSQLLETLAEAVVERPERLPERQEAALLLREVGLLAESRPEGADEPLLLGREVREVGFELLEFRKVAQQHVGIDPVLVDGVEIREEHLAPEVKAVEGLVVEFAVDFVELGDQPHAVGRPQPRNLRHQLVDGRPAGLPERPADQIRKSVGEEDTGTPRREEELQR